MPLYFAYGSNMDIDRMRSRCRSARPVCVSTLAKYRFGYDKPGDKCSYASIRWTGRNSDVVYGVVYHLSDNDLLRLDFYEGVEVQQYYRRKVRVSVSGKRTYVHVYIPCVYVSGRYAPTEQYRKYLLDGAHYFSLPDEYVEAYLK